MKRIFLIVLLVCVFIQPLFPLNMGNIVAYPVPYYPYKSIKKYITIDDRSGGPAGPHNIKMTVYDINGDEVFTRDYSAFPVKWNAYNKNGKLIKPGMYIVKLIVENTATGGEGSKVFRVLITY